MKQTAGFSNSSLTKLSTSIIQKCSAFDLVFEYFDEDGDGKISPAELRSCMRTLGEEISVKDAEVVVELSDSDGDGLLGFEDFVRLMEVEGEDQEKGKELREAFGMYEMEGSGSITPKSLKRMLSRLGESKSVEECKDMIQQFDLNGCCFTCFRNRLRPRIPSSLRGSGS